MQVHLTITAHITVIRSYLEALPVFTSAINIQPAGGAAVALSASAVHTQSDRSMEHCTCLPYGQIRCSVAKPIQLHLARM